MWVSCKKLEERRRLHVALRATSVKKSCVFQPCSEGDIVFSSVRMCACLSTRWTVRDHHGIVRASSSYCLKEENCYIEVRGWGFIVSGVLVEPWIKTMDVYTMVDFNRDSNTAPQHVHTHRIYLNFKASFQFLLLMNHFQRRRISSVLGAPECVWMHQRLRNYWRLRICFSRSKTWPSQSHSDGFTRPVVWI